MSQLFFSQPKPFESTQRPLIWILGDRKDPILVNIGNVVVSFGHKSGWANSRVSQSRRPESTHAATLRSVAVLCPAKSTSYWKIKCRSSNIHSSYYRLRTCVYVCILPDQNLQGKRKPRVVIPRMGLPVASAYPTMWGLIYRKNTYNKN